MITTEYTYFGKPIHIRDNNVYNANNHQWLGHLFTDEHGNKHVLGPANKGKLHKVNQELYHQFTKAYPYIIITEEKFHEAHQISCTDNLDLIRDCILSYNIAEEVIP